MPPKKRSRAGFLNYSKRKEIKSTGEDESIIHSARVARGGERVRSEVGAGSGETRDGSSEVVVGSGEGSGEVRVGSEVVDGSGEGSGEVRVGSEVVDESGEVRVGSGEKRVEGESSGGLMAGAGSEQTIGGSDDEYDSTVKHVKIDDVRAMAAEPLNEWLDNLPRDDVQHYFCIQTIWSSENHYSFCHSQLSAQK